jgi:hypothetical protein
MVFIRNIGQEKGPEKLESKRMNQVVREQIPNGSLCGYSDTKQMHQWR